MIGGIFHGILKNSLFARGHGTGAVLVFGNSLFLPDHQRQGHVERTFRDLKRCILLISVSVESDNTYYIGNYMVIF